MIDLADEFSTAVCSLTPQHIDWLRAATDATAAPMADDKLDEELNDEIPW